MGCIPICYLHKGLDVKGPYGSIFPVFILNISLPLRFAEYFRTEFVWLYPAASDSLCMQLLVLGKRRRSLYAYEYLVPRMNRYVLKPSKERNRRGEYCRDGYAVTDEGFSRVLGNRV